MPGRETMRVRTGLPGAGKSYSVVREIFEFLEESDGCVFHNLPLNTQFFVEHYEKRYDPKASSPLPSPADVRRRLIQIPPDVENSWRIGQSGPSEYFNALGDVSDSWVILDEAHTFIGMKHEAKHRRKWQEFCGELRHRGVVLEFLTQSLGKLADEVECDVAVWIEVSNRETERDPLTKILMGDWYQFAAKMNGVYASAVKSQEYEHSMRRWKKNDRVKVWVQDPYYYGAYSSYSQPKNGGTSGRRLQPFESRTWFALTVWFLRRNLARLVWSPLCAFVLLVCASVYLLYFHSGKEHDPSAVGEVVSSPVPVVPPLFVSDREPQGSRSETPRDISTGLRRNEVYAVFDDGVVVSDGTLVWIGDTFDDKVLESCDPRSGLCTFSGGVRMFVPSFVTESKERESVSGHLRGSSGRSGGTSGSDGDENPRRLDVNDVSAVAQPDRVSEPTSRGFNNNSAGIGRANRVN